MLRLLPGLLPLPQDEPRWVALHSGTSLQTCFRPRPQAGSLSSRLGQPQPWLSRSPGSGLQHGPSQALGLAVQPRPHRPRSLSSLSVCCLAWPGPGQLCWGQRQTQGLGTLGLSPGSELREAGRARLHGSAAQGRRGPPEALCSQKPAQPGAGPLEAAEAALGHPPLFLPLRGGLAAPSAAAPHPGRQRSSRGAERVQVASQPLPCPLSFQTQAPEECPTEAAPESQGDFVPRNRPALPEAELPACRDLGPTCARTGPAWCCGGHPVRGGAGEPPDTAGRPQGPRGTCPFLSLLLVAER